MMLSIPPPHSSILTAPLLLLLLQLLTPHSVLMAAAAPLRLGLGGFFFIAAPPHPHPRLASPKYKYSLLPLSATSTSTSTPNEPAPAAPPSTPRRRGRKKKQPLPSHDHQPPPQPQQSTEDEEDHLLQLPTHTHTSYLPTSNPHPDSDPFHPNLHLSFSDLHDQPHTQQHFISSPLILCFGPAKTSFIPYARPSQRIFSHQIHQAMTDVYWSPHHFFRAPGSAASSVAIALARLDARVDFIGKLGTDSLANDICSQFKAYGVHTQCTKIDDSASTAIAYMKLVMDAGRLTAKCVTSSAEDAIFNSDINWDVLKEAKMLYFNSSALLDSKSKSTLMEVIRIMKSQGSLIFFDVNLPLPLWHSSEETKSFLKEAFAVSNFIELTQHELDFVCEIEQNMTNDRRDTKFVHRSRKRLEEFWHDDLKVVFVTNGTSGLSYYTKETDQYFVGTEDVQIEPSSCDMSASGDALVAALMKMLVSEPDKATDPSYLETSIWYAIESGMMAQTLATLESGFYSD